MNLVVFVGEIVETPKLRESSQGNIFATMTIQTHRPFANSEGVYESDEMSITLWKGIAQTTAEVSSVGDKVAVKGRLQSRNFEGKDGMIHRAYDIIAENVTLLHKKE